METICCSRCGGTGKMPLIRPLREVLEHLRLFNDGDLTAAQLRDALAPEITVTGMNNRLSDLLDLNLVERRKENRQYFWRAK